MPDGLYSVFARLKRGLVEAGKIRPGLTFHGLRKSLDKRAAADGFSEIDIMGALGQTNTASSSPYTLETARTRGPIGGSGRSARSGRVRG